MAISLSEQQAVGSERLTQSYKSSANREAAKIAAIIALYYQQRVDVSDPVSVEAWLAFSIPRLIKSSDSGAERARLYFEAIRTIEVGESLGISAQKGVVDAGVSKSLLTVGPYAMSNKVNEIQKLDLKPEEKSSLLSDAKKVTTANIASAVVRHAQAGGRQTIYKGSNDDPLALGWIRVTRADPCFFCAMLASRGIHYRPFKGDSFVLSNKKFTGDGDAKVHDECGCSLKAVYSKDDPIALNNQQYSDLWSLWGDGAGKVSPILRFRRGYDYFMKTGEYLTWDEADTGTVPFS